MSGNQPLYPMRVTSFKTLIRRSPTGWRWLVTDKYGGATFGQGIEKTQSLSARAARIFREILLKENPSWQSAYRKQSVGR